MQDGSVHGVLHWSAAERFTKYEQCVIMAELFGKSHSHLTPDESTPPGAPRPKDTHLGVHCNSIWACMCCWTM